MAIKVKLGPKAVSFGDPLLGITLGKPGEVVELPDNYRESWMTRSAIRGGQLVVVEAKPQQETPPLKENGELDNRKNDLLKLKRKEIMEEFNFLNEEDQAEAENKSNKSELVDFLLKIEKEYD
jgi:hypothetical protein